MGGQPPYLYYREYLIGETMIQAKVSFTVVGDDWDEVMQAIGSRRECWGNFQYEVKEIKTDKVWDAVKAHQDGFMAEEIAQEVWEYRKGSFEACKRDVARRLYQMCARGKIEVARKKLGTRQRWTNVYRVKK